MHNIKPLALIFTIAMLSGCAEQGGPLTREGVGTAAGAVAGGVLGSTIGSGAGKTVAIVGGALLGGLLGDYVGKEMDQESVDAYDIASQRALESGQTQSWKSNGQSGTITPYGQYIDALGRTCREYSQFIYVRGQRYENRGTACREPDGMWRIVSGR